MQNDNTNESYKQVTKNYKIKKGCLSYQLVTQNAKNYFIFLKAFNLKENDTEEIDKIIKEIQRYNSKAKYNNIKFKILYYLKNFEFTYHKKLFELSNLNKKIFDEILKDLISNRLIKKATNNVNIEHFNNVIKYSGDIKKRDFYALNWDNLQVKEHIYSVDNFVDHEFKKDVEEDKNSFSYWKKAYHEDLKNKHLNQINKNKKKIDKVIEVIKSFEDETLDKDSLYDLLVIAQELVSKRKFKEYMDYLVKYNYIKEIEVNKKWCYLITMRKKDNTEIENEVNPFEFDIVV